MTVRSPAVPGVPTTSMITAPEAAEDLTDRPATEFAVALRARLPRSMPMPRRSAADRGRPPRWVDRGDAVGVCGRSAGAASERRVAMPSRVPSPAIPRKDHPRMPLPVSRPASRMRTRPRG